MLFPDLRLLCFLYLTNPNKRITLVLKTACQIKSEQQLRTNPNNFASKKKKNNVYPYISVQWCFQHVRLVCQFFVSVWSWILTCNPTHGHSDGGDKLSAGDSHRQSQAAEEPRKHPIGIDSLWIRIRIFINLTQPQRLIWTIATIVPSKFASKHICKLFKGQTKQQGFFP